MKRLFLLASILITVVLAGVLHDGYMHNKKIETMPVISQEYMACYPEAMPNIAVDPMTNSPF